MWKNSLWVALAPSTTINEYCFICWNYSLVLLSSPIMFQCLSELRMFHIQAGRNSICTTLFFPCEALPFLSLNHSLLTLAFFMAFITIGHILHWLVCEPAFTARLWILLDGGPYHFCESHFSFLFLFPLLFPPPPNIYQAPVILLELFLVCWGWVTHWPSPFGYYRLEAEKIMCVPHCYDIVRWFTH